jgi:hypothetical protein
MPNWRKKLLLTCITSNFLKAQNPAESSDVINRQINITITDNLNVNKDNTDIYLKIYIYKYDTHVVAVLTLLVPHTYRKISAKLFYMLVKMKVCKQKKEEEEEEEEEKIIKAL